MTFDLVPFYVYFVCLSILNDLSTAHPVHVGATPFISYIILALCGRLELDRMLLEGVI